MWLREVDYTIEWILTNSPGSLYSTPQLYSSVTGRVLGQDPSCCGDNCAFSRSTSERVVAAADGPQKERTHQATVDGKNEF